MKPEYPVKIEGTTVVIPKLDTRLPNFVSNWMPFCPLNEVPTDSKVEEKLATIDNLFSGLYRHKAYNGRAVAMKTGYGPKALSGIVMRALKEIWFVEPWSTRLAIGRLGNYNTFAVDLVYRNQGLIPQYEADGQRNMIPIGLAMGMRAPELRAYVGKQCWKRLIHNSISRNVLIARAVLHCNQDDPQGALRAASRLPSTLLTLAPQRRDVRFLLSALELRPMNSLAKENARLLNMLYDVVLRGGELRRVIRRPEDIEREHERAFPNVRHDFDYHSTSPDLSLPEFEGEVDGVAYKLLRTEDEYEAEGSAKHHCVAVYYPAALRGEYMVLTLSGKVNATAGYRLVGGVFELDQCYGVCNAAIESWPRAKISARLRKYVEEIRRAES